MKFLTTGYFLKIILFLLIGNVLQAQTVIKGEITDANSKEPLIGASIVVVGTSDGTITDYDGSFLLKTDGGLPIQLSISYIGYVTKELEVNTSDDDLKISLDEDAITTEVVEVRGQRISDKQKAAPLTVESLDVLAIKETPSDNFYDGLGSLKGVDLTAASLGFKIVNTRGFNSTSPVRTLQIIDGIDNQAPGLNFSLGNFLGSPELDVLKVDLIVGASSAYYGPNAFNGVIAMETKNPFYQKGLSAQVKAGERNLLETSLRYADVIKNKKGLDFIGYKFNIFYLRADDWQAENYDPIEETRVPANNPGGFDAVNIYGDEYIAIGDKSSPSNQWGENAGLGVFYRSGYREGELANYDTRNLKANVGLYFRTQPEKESESPELILGSNYGYGTTVYQGDNRFSLKNINFFQAKVEYSKRNRYFIRAYMTKEDAGDSYDPYFTALRLVEEGKANDSWGNAYVKWWKDNNIGDQMVELGYPELDFSTFPPTFDQATANQWLIDNNAQLKEWHQMAQETANKPGGQNRPGFLAPGTPEFEEAFNRITTSYSNVGGNGTRFFDKSALYHVHGEYKFTPTFLDEWIVGGNFRQYTPDTRGTIFSDTAGIKITNSEFGFYTGVTKEFFDKKLRANITARVDKNENFDWISTPAASLVWKPSPSNYLRVSFSAGVRNPTLSDQYLNLNVGRAILSGNLEGADSLVTVESFDAYRRQLILDSLQYFSIDAVKPERVKTFEIGYRTTLWNSLYVDAGYYYSIYDDFLGYNIGIEATFDPVSNLPDETQAYRYAANSIEQVQTQGFAIGLSYYFANYFQLNGNYSWNKLITEVDDPIIPAFNTPEHKFNLGVSGRGIPVGNKALGFNVNYKWIDSFIFEGSPQFTGGIPKYQLLDAQVNVHFKNLNTTIKVGASNVLDKQVFQTYGGPRIGRLAYISLLYDWKKK
ncbi:MAG: membrane protein [Saprospiraceae bacterium]|nr:MAG: membrane protein [Saprospiraceae bacterium]